MIDRVLEPEVMDDTNEAAEYDVMDHSSVNRQFVVDLLQSDIGSMIVDFGAGTALIPIELCQQHAECQIKAVDASPSMLSIAQENISKANLCKRIECLLTDAKESAVGDNTADTLISNSLVHHLAEPRHAILEMVRITKPKGRLFVRDLYRPSTQAEVERLVMQHAGQENAFCQQLFRQSLQAALTLDEIQLLVSDLGFSAASVTMTSDRHWTWDALTS